MKSTKRYWLYLLCAVCAGTVSGCGKREAGAAAAPAGPPVVPVSAVAAVREPVPSELRVVGTVEASAVVQVKSQIAGPLERVAFTEGQNVQKGDLLFVIDPRPFQEAVRQADAAVNRDKALIQQTQAALARDTAQAKFAESEAARYAELQKAGAVSRSQSDQSRTNAEATRESARAMQASIESAKAALEANQAAAANARLNLSYTEIRAPISGRTGNLLVHAGNLVRANDVPMVVIHQLAPVFVNFNVPEQHLRSIRRLHAAGRMPVQVFAQDNPGKPATGHLAMIDNAVDTATGTIRLKGTFPNGDGALWPGQFVTVVLTLETIPDAVLVPAEAVQSGQKGPFIFVVKQDNTVESRQVTVGRAHGKRMVIDNGIEAGESVVIDGQLRLAPGSRVRVVPPVTGQS